MAILAGQEGNTRRRWWPQLMIKMGSIVVTMADGKPQGPFEW